jgi:hypothetical protein
MSAVLKGVIAQQGITGMWLTYALPPAAAAAAVY